MDSLTPREERDMTYNGWRSMDTAPKDGRQLLLFAGGDHRIGFWNTQKYYSKPRPFWQYSTSAGVIYMRDNPPSHWAPLLDPPALNEAECLIAGEEQVRGHRAEPLPNPTPQGEE